MADRWYSPKKPDGPAAGARGPARLSLAPGARSLAALQVHMNTVLLRAVEREIKVVI